MERVVIAGMGIAGLTAAIRAAQKGLPVTIIEPREEFLRGQRILLDSNAMQFIESLYDKEELEDNNFINEKIERKHADRSGRPVVQVKDLQKYLLRKLKNLQLIGKNVEIIQGNGVDILKIDAQAKTLTVKFGQESCTIPMSTLICAEGAGRRVIGRFIQNKDNPIPYEAEGESFRPEHHAIENNFPSFTLRNQIPLKYVHQGAISMRLTGTIPNYFQPAAFGPKDLHNLREMGWNREEYPRGYAYLNDREDKVFYVGEVPEQITKIQNKFDQRVALANWVKYIFQHHYGVAPSDLHLDEIPMVMESDVGDKESKAMLKATVFPLTLQCVQESSQTLANGLTIVPIGDAARNANFYLAHGGNDAILTAQVLVDCLSSEGFNPKPYENLQQHLQENFTMGTIGSGLANAGEMQYYMSKLYQDYRHLIQACPTLQRPYNLQERFFRAEAFIPEVFSQEMSEMKVELNSQNPEHIKAWNRLTSTCQQFGNLQFDLGRQRKTSLVDNPHKRKKNNQSISHNEEHRQHKVKKNR